MTRSQGAGLQAGGDVLAVLDVLVAAGLVDRVGDRGDQSGGALAETVYRHVIVPAIQGGATVMDSVFYDD